MVPLQLEHIIALNALGPFVLVHPFARKDFDIDDNAFHSRGHLQRRVLDIARLFSKDRSEQLLLRRQLRFAFGRHLAD